MSVVTKTGDSGETGRFGGGRVPKYDCSVAANGDVDELNSAIGLLLARPDIAEGDAQDLKSVQDACFVIGAELATTQEGSKEAQASIPRVVDGDILKLEARISEIEAALTPQKHFILPGGSPRAAMAFWVRTIARRAERAVSALARERELNPSVLKYLNRLSDYFYVLARYFNQLDGAPEVEWLGREGKA